MHKGRVLICDGEPKVAQYTRVLNVKALARSRAEMKHIMRASTTPEIVRLQLGRAVKLITEILEGGQPLHQFKKQIEHEVKKKARKKIVSLKLRQKISA